MLLITRGRNDTYLVASDLKPPNRSWVVLVLVNTQEDFNPDKVGKILELDVKRVGARYCIVPLNAIENNFLKMYFFYFHLDCIHSR